MRRNEAFFNPDTDDAWMDLREPEGVAPGPVQGRAGARDHRVGPLKAALLERHPVALVLAEPGVLLRIE